MIKEQNLENNKDLQIKDSDIATVEAMHDLLLEKGYLINFITLQRSRELTKKMHAIIDSQSTKTVSIEKILCNLTELITIIKNTSKDDVKYKCINLIKEIDLGFRNFIEESIQNKTIKHTLAKKNILLEANDIIFERQEEKQREYGPIDESLHDASEVASMIQNRTFTTDDVYAVLIGLKISRMRWNKKHDTFLDGIGYLAAYEAYIRKTEKLNKKHKDE